MIKYINEIYNCDYLDIIDDLPAEIFTLLILDVPYFNKGRKTYRRKGKKDIKTIFGNWDEFRDDFDYLDKMKEVIRKSVRILKSNGSIYIFCNDRYISYLRHFIKSQKNMTFANTIVWHKYNMPPRFIDKKKPMFISSKEFILYAYKGDNPIFNVELYSKEKFNELFDVWITPQTPSSERLGHPTQKSESLISKIILLSSNKGDLVGDLFLGSGTTCSTAKKLSRTYFGTELREDYFLMSKQRINSVKIFKDISDFIKNKTIKTLDDF